MKAKQLKNAILQLAIQGKLVPQDPNDEPASELLCKIQAEKDRLIAEGKIKKSKKSTNKAPYTIEPPFEIPESWVWVRLEEVCQEISDIDHKMPQTYNGDDGIPYISPKDFYGKSGIDFAKAKKVSKEDYEFLSRKFAPQRNDIIFPRYGTIGVIRIIEEDIKLLVSYSCACIRVEHKNINMEYVVAYLKSELCQSEIRKYINKTTQPNVGLKSIKQFLIPLPPFPEQHRIVQKIEELLPLVERYDQTEQKLTKLNDTFPEQLKKSVLQAAIQGKLTEQLPTDEPASELLKRIETEKMRLISEGKLKKPRLRDNSQNAKFEPPFEIPQGWEWVRLDNYAYNFDGKRKPVSVEHRSKQKKIYDYYGATGAIDKVEDYIFNGKYILIGEDGGNFFVNRDVAFIVNGKFWANNHVHVLGTSSGLEEYLCLYLNALNLPAMGLINGIAVPKLNQQNLNSIFIAVPPLEEQKRIVEKVELLLSQIERL